MCMKRTDIDIDDRLVSDAMRRFDLRTKKEAVALTLHRLVGEPVDREYLLSLEGTGWGDGMQLDDLRAGVPEQ